MAEKRKAKRFPINLKAHYFPGEERESGKECTIINVSRDGAGLEFYTSEEIVVGSTPLLEIVCPEIRKSTNVEGVVRWVKQGKRDFIGGIEVTARSDEDKLANLLMYTMGI